MYTKKKNAMLNSHLKQNTAKYQITQLAGTRSWLLLKLSFSLLYEFSYELV